MTISVLIVDDHPEVLEKLRTIITKEVDFELVGEATDGEQALEILKKFPADVVFMDFNLPKINGIETARQILADRPDVKIIIISINADSRYVKESFKAGVKGYLIKEYAFEEMVEAIHTVLARDVYVSPSIEIGMLS